MINVLACTVKCAFHAIFVSKNNVFKYAESFANPRSIVSTVRLLLQFESLFLLSRMRLLLPMRLVLKHVMPTTVVVTTSDQSQIVLLRAKATLGPSGMLKWTLTVNLSHTEFFADAGIMHTQSR